MFNATWQMIGASAASSNKPISGAPIPAMKPEIVQAPRTIPTSARRGASPLKVDGMNLQAASVQMTIGI